MLQISHLQKNYPGFALDVDLEVLPGRITGLIGENGAGKSTLMKAVLGLIFADGGEIRLFGQEPHKIREEDLQRIGTVFAESGPSGYLTIAQEKKILKAFYKDFDLADYEEKCRRLRLDENKKIKDLSTGMRAKLKLICAMTHKADLLVLDEPTAGLDVIARDELLNMLRDYMAENENRAVLISSHISSDLESLCDDFYMIHDGKIVLHEETDRLFSNYAVLKVDEKQFEQLEKKYILKKRKEAFGYVCLTNERQFYLENYPELVIERSGLDELILLMVRGEKL